MMFPFWLWIISQLVNVYLANFSASKTEAQHSTRCSEKKHRLSISAVSLWKMFEFIPNIHGMFKMDYVFRGHQSSIFFAMGDVTLMSCMFVSNGFCR